MSGPGSVSAPSQAKDAQAWRSLSRSAQEKLNKIPPGKRCPSCFCLLKGIEGYKPEHHPFCGWMHNESRGHYSEFLDFDFAQVDYESAFGCTVEDDYGEESAA